MGPTGEGGLIRITQNPGRNKPFQAQNFPADAKVSENFWQFLSNLRPIQVLKLKFFGATRGSRVLHIVHAGTYEISANRNLYENSPTTTILNRSQIDLENVT